MTRPGHPRIACVVPHCGRGTRRFPPGTTVICGKCWRDVDSSIKRRLASIRRRIANGERGRGPLKDVGQERRRRVLAVWRLSEQRTWEAAVESAVEGRAGL